MPRAALPADELQRLSALHQFQILDTPAEAAFDEMTAMAVELCDTPIGAISLVDTTRQWFKSRIGVDYLETSRDGAFCAHAILSDHLLEVPDATRDPRFADNPFVLADGGIRFYAGAPLVTPEGFRIGTLGVIDTVPRALSARQRNLLAGLSRQVVRQFEARRQARELTAHVLRDAALVSALRQAEIEVRRTCRIDSLTGLPNRSQFVDLLEAAVARGKRHDSGIAVVFLDIDHFRQINSSVGAATGDELLLELSRRVKQAVRATDTVARLAGDEFVAVLEGLHSAADAQRVAQKILASLAQPWRVDAACLSLQFSAGIAYDATHSHAATALIGYADELLYLAKAAGGNTFRITAC